VGNALNASYAKKIGTVGGNPSMWGKTQKRGIQPRSGVAFAIYGERIRTAYARRYRAPPGQSFLDRARNGLPAHRPIRLNYDG